MGILQKLFGHEKKEPVQPAGAPMTVLSPADGTAISLTEFPDQVFSQEILGKGCGILPAGELVTAPFNGTVTQVTDTRHAVGVTSGDGVEVLIHVGVDTVEMNGAGFRCYVKNGQKIRLGDPLMEFDRETIQNAGHSDAIAVVVTNSDEFSAVEFLAPGPVSGGGTPVLRVEKKQ